MHAEVVKAWGDEAGGVERKGFAHNRPPLEEGLGSDQGEAQERSLGPSLNLDLNLGLSFCRSGNFRGRYIHVGVLSNTVIQFILRDRVRRPVLYAKELTRRQCWCRLSHDSRGSSESAEDEHVEHQRALRFELAHRWMVVRQEAGTHGKAPQRTLREPWVDSQPTTRRLQR